MVRDEKEELFHKSIPRRGGNFNTIGGNKTTANPIYLQNLENYLEKEDEERKNLISNLNKNMKNI